MRNFAIICTIPLTLNVNSILLVGQNTQDAVFPFQEQQKKKKKYN